MTVLIRSAALVAGAAFALAAPVSAPYALAATTRPAAPASAPFRAPGIPPVLRPGTLDTTLPSRSGATSVALARSTSLTLVPA